MSETRRVTNRDLWGMVSALRAFGNRRMATWGADLKVGRMLLLLGPYAEPIEAARRRIELDHLGEAGVVDLPPLAQRAALVRLAAAQVALDEEMVEVALPLSLALKEADLPKRKKDENADDPDCTGLGALLADLGPLFLLPD